MTIDDAYRFIAFVVSKETSGEITPQNFNNLAPLMQLSVIHDRLKPQYDEAGKLTKGFGVNDKMREELRPILVNPQNLAVSAGRLLFPDDYLYMDSLTTTPELDLITEAGADELAILQKSQIKPPSATYPKYVIHQNGFNIWPVSISAVRLAYLRRPLTPLWNHTMANDRAVYAATGGIIGAGNSQDFEIEGLAQLEVCWKILSAVGVNLNLETVIGYSQIEQKKGS